MSQPYIGEIRLVPFNFAPLGWSLCDGSLQSISQNTTLFSLIGTTYGGDGVNTFGLPDLRGRTPIHLNSSLALGQLGGTEQVTLSVGELAPHSHGMAVNSALGSTGTASGNYLATAPLALGNVYGTGTDSTLNASAVAVSGGNQPHNNMQPFLTLNYIISLFGIYPPQN